MKVLIINGSPHIHSTTYTALHEVEKTLSENHIDTEIITIGNKQIRGCIGCNQCETLNQCVFNDDLVNETLLKLKEADGLLIGSPVYYASPNGTLLAFLDRLFYANPYDLSMKVGASVVVARRAGTSTSFDVLNKYFTISNMPIASSSYWNNVHGLNGNQAKLDLEGMQVMRNLGRNMAFLIQSIQLGKEKYGLPVNESSYHTNFIDEN